MQPFAKIFIWCFIWSLAFNFKAIYQQKSKHKMFIRPNQRILHKKTPVAWYSKYLLHDFGTSCSWTKTCKQSIANVSLPTPPHNGIIIKIMLSFYIDMMIIIYANSVCQSMIESTCYLMETFSSINTGAHGNLEFFF